MSLNVEKNFVRRLQEFPKGVTPGFHLRLYEKGKLKVDTQWGNTWPYYDLASLTKILFTVPLIMKAVEGKKLHAAKKISASLPWWNPAQTLEGLLTHTAGNEWWKPYYKDLAEVSGREQKKAALRILLRAEKPKSSVKKAVYSDIDFFLLGFLLEASFEKEWFPLAQETFCQWGLENDIFFHENNQLRFSKSKYAPTEKCAWRKRTLQGEVHDENTWALGGVAPQAGLFGTMEGISQWALQLRQVHQGAKLSGWTSTAILRKFTSRSIPPTKGDWALGFMMPTAGSASCGSQFSLKSFGHTGFTGTSIWMDPVKDRMVLLLSNRVHPTRKNEAFRKWRPWLHDAVIESLRGE